MRNLVVVGQRARASSDFLLVDIPSTSGRLDVLLRCLRAGLLISHGVRRDTTVYLVLLGDPARVRSVRFDGAAAKYLRPDERSLATVLKRAFDADCPGPGFSAVREGIAIAPGGLEPVLAELGAQPIYLLEEAAADIRGRALTDSDCAFVLGDHLGLPAPARARLIGAGAQCVSVGPISVHSEDVIGLVHNELDRRERAREPGPREPSR